MLTLSCHCGAVRVRTNRRPDYLHECNCTLCGKTGARWGYFGPSDVSVEGIAAGYCRQDKDDPGARMQFCATCGVTTHFVLTESAVARFGNVVMGVNMRLAEERDLAGIELRYPDGRAWAGQGEFGYVREARIIGQAAASDDQGDASSCEDRGFRDAQAGSLSLGRGDRVRGSGAGEFALTAKPLTQPSPQGEG